MIRYSQQHRIISNLSLSFQNEQKTYTKISEKILKRDKIFYNPEKYETYTENNFQFITLWTTFKNNLGKIKILGIMNEYTKDDIKIIMRQKEKLLLYKNTFENDLVFMKQYDKRDSVVLDMYLKNKISYMYIYVYFKDRENLGRINSKKIKRIRYFLSYFPAIKSYLDEQSTRV